MTYGPTVQYLREKALEAGAASFWHGKQQTQSINYNAEFPQLHLFLMPSPLVDMNVQYQVVACLYGRDTYESPADLSQVDPATGELAAEASLTIQDEMDLLSQEFISLLRQDGQFDMPDRIDRAPVLREGSQIGTGFLVSFTLTARAAIC